MTTTTRAVRPAGERAGARRAATRRPVPSRRRRRRPGRRTGWRPSRRLLLWGGAAVGLVVALLTLVLLTPVMSVRSVEVDGLSGATADTIRELADVEMGGPLARVDTDAIADRLRTLPELASVTVQRSWPSTVTLVVIERVPLAVVDRDGTQWLIDADGVLFAQVTSPPAGLPALVVDAAGPADASTRAALDVLQVLPADILARVGRITATSADGVRLKLVGGRTVVWGSAEDSARKAEVLAAVFGQPGGLIDVSSPEAVVIR